MKVLERHRGRQTELPADLAVLCTTTFLSFSQFPLFSRFYQLFSTRRGRQRLCLGLNRADMRYIEVNISAWLLICQRMCFVFSYSSQRARGNQKQVKPPKRVEAELLVQANFLVISICLFCEQMAYMCLWVLSYRRLLFGFSTSLLQGKSGTRSQFLYSLDFSRLKT